MRLGSQTASVMNHLMARGVIGQPVPVAGMGVTMLAWTDRYPGTVFRVFKIGKAVAIEVREDDYRRIDKNGLSEDQDYEFKVNVNGCRRYFRQDADGYWVECHKNPDTGRWNGPRGTGKGLRLGQRGAYYDPSF